MLDIFLVLVASSGWLAKSDIVKYALSWSSAPHFPQSNLLGCVRDTRERGSKYHGYGENNWLKIASQRSFCETCWWQAERSKKPSG